MKLTSEQMELFGRAMASAISYTDYRIEVAINDETKRVFKERRKAYDQLFNEVLAMYAEEIKNK